MSGTIRRQIGQQKRWLIQIIRNIDDTQNEKLNFVNATNEELQDEYDYKQSLHEDLLKSFSRIEQLDHEWSALMTTNPNEATIQTEYIAKYGNYKDDMNKAVSTLERMDEESNILEQEMEKRGIPLQSSLDPGSPEEGSSRFNQAFDEPLPISNNRTKPQLLSPIQNPNTNYAENLAQPQLLQQTSLPINYVPQATIQHIVPNVPQQQPVSYFDAAMLTRLDLPDFSGDMVMFPEYWSRFNALVHSKPIDAASKFSLLKSTLRGEALQCIQGIPVTDTNYRIAIDMLLATYDDRPTIRHILYTKLFNLPTCDDTGKKLQSLFNEMQKLVRQYVALDTTECKEYGLGAVLLNKLPKVIRSKVYDKNPDHHNISPLELLNIVSGIVKKEVTLTEMCGPTQRNHDAYHVHNQNRHQRQTIPQSQQRQFQGTPNRNPTAACVFCGRNNHKSFECRTHSTTEDRTNIVRNRRLCFNCLGEGHSNKFCRSKRTCGICNQRHHTAICTANNQLGTTNNRTMPAQRNAQPFVQPTRQYQPPPQNQTFQRNIAPIQNQQTTPQQSRWNYNGNRSSGQNRISTTAQTNYIATTAPESRPPIADVYTINTTTNGNCHAPTPMPEPHTYAANESTNPTVEPVIAEESVLLMCTEVTLVNPEDPEKTVVTTAFLDSGSNRSYISKDLASQLQLNTIQEEELILNVFGEQQSRLPASLHKLGLFLDDGSTKQMNVKALPILTNQMKTVTISDSTMATLRTAKNLPTTDVKPGLLIGNDYFWEIMLNSEFYWETLPSGYRLLHSKIGPIITGKNDNCVHFISTDKHSETISDNLPVTEQLDRFWNFESIGMMEDTHEKDDDVCMQHFENTIRFDDNDNRYMVKWPFRMPTTNLPTNKELALCRLRSIWNSLSKNPENLIKYHNILVEQLERNIIEEAPVITRQEEGSNHYLAHHAVITENKKTTKVRMVFDGSAKQSGQLSLNEHLYKGPCLIPDLCGVLLRSRLAPILVSADIEKAFLMIGLEEPDRNFVKFFWLKDYMKPPTSDNLITYRFRRVPFGIISSPFLLSATIHHHIALKGNSCTGLLSNLYVDNCFVSCQTTSEAVEIYNNAKKLFTDASMNLREWYSNDKDFNKFIKETEKIDTLDAEQNILGLKWNIDTDTLLLRLPSIDTTVAAWTKRKILTTVASTFDPLGLLIPATLPGKQFLQSLWKENLNWDQKMSSAQTETWMTLLNNFCTREGVRVPRVAIAPSATATYSLHIFCDASKHAYAAAAYLQKEDVTTGNQTRLIFAKSRLSPLKNATTIPRLELSSVTIASSISKYLHNEIDIPIAATYIWSDSKVALQWIKSDKHLPIFIQNRVKIIMKNAPQAEIRHVPTSLNPADVASRGCSLEDLLSHHLWWTGPPFLQKSKEEWPQDISLCENQDNTDTDATYAVKECPPPPPIPIDVLKTTSFSNWDKLLFMTTFVLFFILKKLKPVNASRLFPYLTSNLNTSAMMCLFQRAQSEFPPTDKVISQLQLYKDKTGLYRCKGRMVTLNLTDNVRNPIYLPRESYITKLYILHIHRLNQHSGTSMTLIHLRQTVWIPRGRSTVKSVLHKECYKCKRFQAKPFQLPSFADYPAERTTKPPYPFWNTALDYCGPFTCKDGNNEKIYICLFTCLSTRAIYVDVAIDMSAHTFLNILRRFIATNGSPNWILSDNASNFKCTANAFKIVDHTSCDLPAAVIDYCRRKSITFKFVPAFSPWSGGVYERMIGIFKNAFKFAIGRKLLNTDDLRTITKEIEAIVNSRPLTYVPSDDLDKFIEPLRPIDFIRPGAIIGAPRFDTNIDEWKLSYSTQDNLVSEWKQLTSSLDKFWTRWSTEYLTTLRENTQRTHTQGYHLTKRTPIVGELVLIHEDFADRGQWKLARISEFNDDLPRSVQLLLPNRKYITRPISLIYPLEVSNSPNQQKSLPVKDKPQLHQMVTRSKSKLLNTNILFLFTLLLTLFTTSTALPPIHTIPNTRCPEEPTLAKTIVYGDNCKKEGIVIASYINTKNQARLCWFHVQCPLGHLRIKIPMPLNTGYCGEECPCPQWTEKCSHYNGSRRKESTISLVPSSLKHFVPTQVCSFSKSLVCSKEKRLGVFSQIQLFDGSKLIVPDLHIDISDQVHQNDFICFTMSGKMTKSTKGATTGTTAYCSQFSCTTKNPIRYCTFPSAPAFFEYQKFRIPIQAWGTAAKEYYPPEINESLQSTHHYTRCSKGGAQIFNSNLQFVEACISTTCVYISNYVKETSILFPTALVIYNYNLSVTVWKDGEMILQERLHCPGQPICEVISCTICREHIYNVQCWTWSEVIVAVVVWIVITVLYYLLKPTFRILQLFFRILLWPLRRSAHLVCLSICRQRKIQQPTSTTPQFRSRYQRRRTKVPVIALCLMILPSTTLTCSDITSLTASTKSCVTDENNEQCTFDETTIMSLQPLGQETCLVLRNQKDDPMGLLSIRLHGITNVCNKKESFYTRDHVFKSESSHRCYSAGSCQKDKCTGTSTGDRLEEFSTIANESPGYTFCVGSCQCITCNKCFLCEPSCLFYRYYAVPEGNTVYTVFRCPTWSLQVTGSATLRTNNTSISTTFTLSPARKFTWNSISLSLTGVTSPHIPLLGNTFFTDGKRTSMIGDQEAGHFTLNSPGQLQCQSKADATKFACQFPVGACTCSPSSYSVKCSCPDGLLQPYLLKNTLPMKVQGLILKNEKRIVTATTQQGSAVQIQVSMTGVTLQTKTEKNICNVTSSEIGGCYACTTGATINLTCQSSIGEETGDVQCGNRTSIVICTKSGQTTTIHMNYDHSAVNDNCTISCPGGSSTFELRGTLAYVNEGIFIANKDVETEIRNGKPTEIELPSLLSFFWNNVSTICIIIFSVIVIFAFVYLYCFFKNAAHLKLI